VSEDQTILVIDDEPANVQLIERLLQRSGYSNVHGTTDPTEAVTLYRRLNPDLVMLDLHMPILDGFGVMGKLIDALPAGDYLPILVLTADVAQETKQRALLSGARDFLTKPFDQAEVLARVRNLLDTRSLHQQLRRHNELLEERVAERTTTLRDTLSQLERAHQDLRLAQEETIHSLSLAAEFRDVDTSRHIERMSRYCEIMAEGMGFDDNERQTIRLAAKMHDVGKIGVPDSILLKPGKLTPDEFETMKTHAQIGYDILSGSTSALSKTAAVIAWTHHEKVDGSGYPRGLRGDAISREGRLAAVADVFDALTSNRVYREAFDLPEAFGIMREGRGNHFDADILDLFFDRISQILRLKRELDARSSAPSASRMAAADLN
jgi:putative two-component system response regulator